MNLDERIRSTLKKVIDLPNDLDEIDENVDFIAKYQIDSVMLIQLLIAIEDEFSIVIDDEHLMIENLSSINKIKVIISEAFLHSEEENDLWKSSLEL